MPHAYRFKPLDIQPREDEASAQIGVVCKVTGKRLPWNQAARAGWVADLNGPARQRAIDEHREFLGREWNGGPVIEDAKQVFAFAGWDVSKVYFSGFWSQGDGACFVGQWRAVDVSPDQLREWAPQDQALHAIADRFAKLAKQYPAAWATVAHRGHYSHEFCTDFSISADEDGNEMPNEAEKEFIDASREAMRWIYSRLQSDYEATTEESAVIESLEANEYEFTENGKIDA